MRAIVQICLGVSLATVSAGLVAYPPPPPDPTLPASTVPTVVQQMRRDMLDPSLNSLTFRNMEELFTTRTVARSGRVWQLPRADRQPTFQYTFKGKSYTTEQFLDRTYTNALLVMKKGRIVYERYQNNSTPATRFIGFSMTKSWTSILVGIALEEGRIASIDDPVDKYLPELAKGGYAGVSIRHVLQMRSGVDYEERFDFDNPSTASRNHENSLVRNVVRFADAGRTIARKNEPGKVWAYKTLDTAVLGWLLERVSGGSSVTAFTTQRLWEPLGAESDAYYIMDGEPGIGREFSGAGLGATLRDFARLGQMVLNGGVADGRRIVSSKWLEESTRPTGGDGPGYGYQWWMGLRPGSFGAEGLQGQYVYIDPTSQTVVVKLSHYPPGAIPPADMSLHEETQTFMAAASAWTAD